MTQIKMKGLILTIHAQSRIRWTILTLSLIKNRIKLTLARVDCFKQKQQTLGLDLVWRAFTLATQMMRQKNQEKKTIFNCQIPFSRWALLTVKIYGQLFSSNRLQHPLYNKINSYQKTTLQSQQKRKGMILVFCKNIVMQS